ncbi:hypothetical protein F2P81_018454 [Scophthalmus maximus]|uniref:BED-type domain-containing protein n=1 Tax=Scophthalmus maximus TaxID=52904 RepID=A0A6A4S9V6_SCOMX|nr:hypothetical protein F2P81_018454 [Scophthalmus maximus]
MLKKPRASRTVVNPEDVPQVQTSTTTICVKSANGRVHREPLSKPIKITDPETGLTPFEMMYGRPYFLPQLKPFHRTDEEADQTLASHQEKELAKPKWGRSLPAPKIGILKEEKKSCFKRVVNYSLRSCRCRSAAGWLELPGAVSGIVRNGGSMSTDNIRAAPSKYKADVWVHFGFKNKPGSMDLDKANAICKLCHAAVKYSGNTTNLRTHLVRRHADTIKLQQQPKPVDLRQTTLDDTTNKFSSTSSRAVKITESVVLLIRHDLRPYSVVENTGFRYMVNTMEPCYVIPTCRYITEVAVPRMYEEVKQVVKTSLGSAERVAPTCDGWTSRATESYVMITSHHIDQEWKLISHVLQTRATHESHTSGNIVELLKRALEKWDRTSKDPAIVTNNTSNMTMVKTNARTSVLESSQKLQGARGHFSRVKLEWREETETDVNVLPEDDEESNQGPVQEDISAVPFKRSRHSCSLADLLGQTYAAGAAKKLKTAED